MTHDCFDNNRVLVIDDNAQIHDDFRKILAPAAGDKRAELERLRALMAKGAGAPAATTARPFLVDVASQGEEGLAKVEQGVRDGRPYALAFVDMRMPPGWDGLRTIRELWCVDPDLQVVVCTAYADQPWSEIEAAARDTDRLLVLKKPFDAVEVKQLAATLCAKWTLGKKAAMKLAHLEHAVAERTAELELARQKDQLHLEELAAAVERRTAELRQAATHDALTGLPNRTLFHDRLSQALAHAARAKDYHVAVLFLDFDRFKVVNDSLGHEAGDQLLKMIGTRLASVLRETDTVTLMSGSGATAARLGGDEFCILLTGLRRPADAQAVAVRMLDALARPYALAGREIHSTASIGISVASGGGPARAEDMVRDADIAMFRAKAEGRGRAVMFDRAMHAQALDRLTIENDLCRSIERRELRTFYQPVVSLATGEIVGVEALVRWMHPQRGCVNPSAFIKIAEETGFIEPLGLWVLEDACTQVARWKGALPRAGDLRLNVNVSSRQLYEGTFPQHVREVLARTGMPADMLNLEITESVLMGGEGDAQEALRQLRGIGVRTFLDDFGTGFASLGLLHTFLLDGLKIDRSFVMDASGKRRFAAIVHAIMNLVHNLGMEGIAEGLESIEHVALLQALGCAKGQGFLFSPPVPAEEMERLLRLDVRGWVSTGVPAA
jgi:diguanylate cyclase (GGDEF)-like protein